MKDREYKIIQIIPAGGWYGRFRTADNELFDAPLICWALVEFSDGTREVRGFEGADNYASDVNEDSGFRHYVHELRLASTVTDGETIQ